MSVNPAESEQQVALADKLYEQYTRPLEAEHHGEYLAVSPTGQSLLAPTLLEAIKQATRAYGPGNYIFRIGDEAVGEWL